MDRWLVLCCAALLGLVSAGPGAAQGSRGREVPSIETATGLYGDCEDPVELLLLSRARIGTDDDLSAALVGIRERYPELFRVTPPPAGKVRMPAPYEPASTLILAYPAIEGYDPWFAELVAEATSEGQVAILVDVLDREALATLLSTYGVDPHEVTFIDDIPFESVWMRDYGPVAIETDQGVALVDPRYFLNCIYNDAVPTHLAEDLGSLRVYRPPLWLEGGDLLSNGAGMCFSTVQSAMRNGLGAARYKELLEEYFGCEQTVLLSPIVGNAAEHVDLFLTVAAEDLVLLAEFDPEEDPTNAAIMDLNHAALAEMRTSSGKALHVSRVPMPPPANTRPRDPNGPVIRSYLNLLVFNGAVIVPVYPGSTDREADALREIRRAFPERRIVPLPVESLALDEGALHCVTVTIPVTRRNP